MLEHGIPPAIAADRAAYTGSNVHEKYAKSACLSWGELSAADLKIPSLTHAGALLVQATQFMGRPQTSWAPRHLRESSRRGM